LLENYVFKVVPMLNPDGVSRGYWRLDTLGLNLNRYYKEPTPEAHPTIFAAKNAVISHKDNLKLYVDFHAHCTKKGFFIFGNSQSDQDL
jgi:murein tripeptide amidase MpaA